MRRIGIIGGMSWQSSAVLYRLVNEFAHDAQGGHASADCVMTSVNFDVVRELQLRNDWDGAGELLADRARSLRAAGAEAVTLCTNTMHKVAPAIVEALGDVPFLHVADSVAARCEAIGAKTVGLLGTRCTMSDGFYLDLLEARGLTVWVPDPAAQVDVDSIIFEHLVHGRTPASARERYREVMAALERKGCEAIVLGCTEIGLLVDDTDATVPLVDTTVEQARTAVDFMLA